MFDLSVLNLEFTNTESDLSFTLLMYLFIMPLRLSFDGSVQSVIKHLQSTLLLPYQPNKQYISIIIEQLCKKYIEDPLSTYRKIAPNIGYQNAAPTVIDERQLSHSTVWRWIPCLEQMS